MATDKQLNANRINARKSRGPITEEGKDIVRQNALKHGLRAKKIDVIPGEKAAEFAAHVDAWIKDFAPRNAYENHLIRNAARLSWKLDRASRHEVAALSRRINDAIDACNDDSPEALAEAAALASFDPGNEGERLRRYQFTLHRELRRDMDSFSKQRLQPLKGVVGGANEPNFDGSSVPNKPNSLARRGSHDPADTDGRRPPEPSAPNKPNPLTVVAEPSAPNKPNSGNVRQECRTHERVEVLAQNESPEPSAPNKPNSAEPAQVSSTFDKARPTEPNHPRPTKVRDARRRPKTPTLRPPGPAAPADRARLRARSIALFEAGCNARPLSLGF